MSENCGKAQGTHKTAQTKMIVCLCATPPTKLQSCLGQHSTVTMTTDYLTLDMTGQEGCSLQSESRDSHCHFQIAQYWPISVKVSI